MALQLTKELDTGVSCNYWRIASLVLDYKDQTAKCVVELYKDSAARAAGKAPAYSIGYGWIGTSFSDYFAAEVQDTLNYNPQERAYVLLKTLPEFTGAVDA